MSQETSDHAALQADKEHVRRTRNLRLIPSIENRRGGKLAAVEWAHVIGIFQTLLFLLLDGRPDAHILDVGCGTGLLAISSEPFVSDGGLYTGIDVSLRDVEFCRSHYREDWFTFQHHAAHNPVYAQDQAARRPSWEVASASQDAVTALSVWTHLDAADARHYFLEIDRVLRPGGKALVTFFLLDDTYTASLARRSGNPGRYHMTEQNLWIFDQPMDGEDWFHPDWVDVPEMAVGVTRRGVEGLTRGTALSLRAHYMGNWKEVPGVFFQDVLVFEKQSGAAMRKTIETAVR